MGDKSVISRHIKNVNEEELKGESTVAKFATVQKVGKRTVTRVMSNDKALTEFEKYRVKQDKLFKSDFDLLLEETKENNNKVEEVINHE